MFEEETCYLRFLFSSQGDLGAIGGKYDIAVSTACSPLDNIVVDSMTTAQRCVELLIKHNVGVATFIGLDKMEKWKEHTKRKITTSVWLPFFSTESQTKKQTKTLVNVMHQGSQFSLFQGGTFTPS